MQIKLIKQNKTAFLELLLLGDEEQSMIEKYLDRCELFALFDEDLKTVCAVTKESEGMYEIKNIATYSKFQGQGYAKKMIEYVFCFYKKDLATMLVGTGDSPGILTFYQSLGFTYSHRVKNFFTDNYEKPIFEDGKQLIDMIYLHRHTAQS